MEKELTIRKMAVELFAILILNNKLMSSNIDKLYKTAEEIDQYLDDLPPQFISEWVDNYVTNCHVEVQAQPHLLVRREIKKSKRWKTEPVSPISEELQLADCYGFTYMIEFTEKYFANNYFVSNRITVPLKETLPMKYIGQTSFWRPTIVLTKLTGIAYTDVAIINFDEHKQKETRESVEDRACYSTISTYIHNCHEYDQKPTGTYGFRIKYEQREWKSYKGSGDYHKPIMDIDNCNFYVVNTATTKPELDAAEHELLAVTNAAGAPDYYNKKK